MTLPAGGMPPSIIDDELLSAYLDGQVSPAEHERVEWAIATDPTVRQRVADLRATVALLRALPQPVPRRTFILTPEHAAAIRPVRVPWITRIFPTVAAVGAIAAVLCLVLVAGDLATGGFRTKQSQAQGTAPRSAAESVTDATNVTSAAVAPVTAVAAAATSAPAPQGVAGSVSSARSTSALPAPAVAAAPAPTGTSAALRPAATSAAAVPAAPAASGGSLPVSPAPATSLPATAPSATTVANAQPPPSPATSAQAYGAATVTSEKHRVPVALVRVGEIALALLALSGVALALIGWRGRRMRARTGNL